jgi:hypothetical protein
MKIGERPLPDRPPGEASAAPEDDAPVLLQDRALQAFEEGVGPRLARLRANVAQAEPLRA